MPTFNDNDTGNTVDGTVDDDIIYGNGGDDTLNGLGGDDILEGGEGDDELNGGADDDTLIGGAGDDILNGNSGSDTLVAGDHAFLIDDPLGYLLANDPFALSDSGNDTLDGGFASNGNSAIFVFTGRTESIVNEFSPIGPNDITVGGIVVASFASIGSLVLIGGQAGDTLTGRGGDIIFGGEGDDFIDGRAGNDYLSGGPGDDSINGGSDFDFAIYAWATGNVAIDLTVSGVSQNTGGAGTDSISNIEGVIGSAFNDTLTGTDDENWLIGGDGDDTLSAARGQDILDPGDGNDVVDGGDSFFDGLNPNNTPDWDWLDNRSASSGLSINLTITTAQVVNAQRTQTITGIENLLGSEFNDNLTGDGGINVLFGEAGDDLLSGGAEGDALFGGAGGDTLNGEDGDDILSGGGGHSIGTVDVDLIFGDDGGDDTLNGGAGDDLIHGGLGNDTVDGGDGEDTVTFDLFSAGVTVDLGIVGVQDTVNAGMDSYIGIENIDGSDFNDTLAGDDQENALFGGEGSDVLSGAGGDDILRPGTGGGEVHGGAGSDTLDFRFNDSNSLHHFTVDLSNLSAQNTGFGGVLTISGIERVLTGNGNDTVTGDGNANLIDTAFGNDSLFGGAGDDLLFAGDGNNTINGGDGFDIAFYTFSTRDLSIDLRSGGQQATGDTNDTLTSIEGLLGGSGDDTLFGNSEDNLLNGYSGDDHLEGLSGDDWLYGRSGHDTLIGGAGNDVIYGDGTINIESDLSITDRPTFGVGHDTLSGGDGSDWLHGGGGNDILDGGLNVDTAVFSGNFADYVISTSGDTVTITGADGTDTLTNVEFLEFDDQTFHWRPGTGQEIDFGDDPDSFMSQIRDFDGNDLGAPNSWNLIGSVDIQGDGDLEYLFFNRDNGRWATVGPAEDGLVYFDDHGWAGDTRVVGIYIDPLVESGDVEQGSDHDSQRRFQNDINIGNIAGILGADDYDGDGLQEVYFSLTDGTAYLHAYMHADGNIRYANYQNEQQVIDYLTDNGYSSDTWDGWFDGASSLVVGQDDFVAS